MATERAPTNTGTLWVGTRRGRVFVSTNADAAAASVAFDRIDDVPHSNIATPTRMVSGISIDPADPNHAIVSFTSYNAYATAAGTATGHVFDVVYNPGTGTAVWTDRSLNLGDEPITSVVID